MWRSGRLCSFASLWVICATMHLQKNSDAEKWLDIRVATFNMNGKSFRDIGERDFEDWLCAETKPDVLVVSTQETGAKASILPTGTFAQQLEDLRDRLFLSCRWSFHGSRMEYVGQVGLFVFQREGLEHIMTDTINLGTFNLPNKGMAFMRFRYGGTYYTFAAVHLAADKDGFSGSTHREEDLKLVNEALWPPMTEVNYGWRGSDHVVIIAGDFNTRVKVGGRDPSTYEEMYDEFHDRLKDELRGYRECKIEFSATFKKSIGEEESKDRIPKEESKDRIPKEESKDRIPKEESKDRLPKEDNEDRIPKEDNKDRIPKEESKDPIPEKYNEDRIPSWTDRIIISFHSSQDASSKYVYEKPQDCESNAYYKVSVKDDHKKQLSDHDAVVLSNINSLRRPRKPARRKQLSFGRSASIDEGRLRWQRSQKMISASVDAWNTRRQPQLSSGHSASVDEG